MAKASGRLSLIKKGGTTIGGGRTVGITVNGSPVNVEDQGDSGWASFLSGVMTGKTVELTIDGYEEDQVLQAIALGADSGKFMSDITFTFPGGTIISGDFVMTAYSESGQFEDGQTFTATFSSDGAPTVT